MRSRGRRTGGGIASAAASTAGVLAKAALSSYPAQSNAHVGGLAQYLAAAAPSQWQLGIAAHLATQQRTDAPALFNLLCRAACEGSAQSATAAAVEMLAQDRDLEVRADDVHALAAAVAQSGTSGSAICGFATWLSRTPWGLQVDVSRLRQLLQAVEHVSEGEEGADVEAARHAGVALRALLAQRLLLDEGPIASASGAAASTAAPAGTVRVSAEVSAAAGPATGALGRLVHAALHGDDPSPAVEAWEAAVGGLRRLVPDHLSAVVAGPLAEGLALGTTVSVSPPATLREYLHRASPSQQAERARSSVASQMLLLAQACLAEARRRPLHPGSSTIPIADEVTAILKGLTGLQPRLLGDGQPPSVGDVFSLPTAPACRLLPPPPSDAAVARVFFAADVIAGCAKSRPLHVLVDELRADAIGRFSPAVTRGAAMAQRMTVGALEELAVVPAAGMDRQWPSVARFEHAAAEVWDAVCVASADIGRLIEESTAAAMREAMPEAPGRAHKLLRRASRQQRAAVLVPLTAAAEALERLVRAVVRDVPRVLPSWTATCGSAAQAFSEPTTTAAFADIAELGAALGGRPQAAAAAIGLLTQSGMTAERAALCTLRLCDDLRRAAAVAAEHVDAVEYSGITRFLDDGGAAPQAQLADLIANADGYALAQWWVRLELPEGGFDRGAESMGIRRRTDTTAGPRISATEALRRSQRPADDDVPANSAVATQSARRQAVMVDFDASANTSDFRREALLTQCRRALHAPDRVRLVQLCAPAFVPGSSLSYDAALSAAAARFTRGPASRAESLLCGLVTLEDDRLRLVAALGPAACTDHRAPFACHRLYSPLAPAAGLWYLSCLRTVDPTAARSLFARLLLPAHAQDVPWLEGDWQVLVAALECGTPAEVPRVRQFASSTAMSWRAALVCASLQWQAVVSDAATVLAAPKTPRPEATPALEGGTQAAHATVGSTIASQLAAAITKDTQPARWGVALELLSSVRDAAELENVASGRYTCQSVQPAVDDGLDEASLRDRRRARAALPAAVDIGRALTPFVENRRPLRQYSITAAERELLNEEVRDLLGRLAAVYAPSYRRDREPRPVSQLLPAHRADLVTGAVAILDRFDGCRRFDTAEDFELFAFAVALDARRVGEPIAAAMIAKCLRSRRVGSALLRHAEVAVVAEHRDQFGRLADETVRALILQRTLSRQEKSPALFVERAVTDVLGLLDRQRYARRHLCELAMRLWPLDSQDSATTLIGRVQAVLSLTRTYFLPLEMGLSRPADNHSRVRVKCYQYVFQQLMRAHRAAMEAGADGHRAAAARVRTDREAERLDIVERLRPLWEGADGRLLRRSLAFRFFIAAPSRSPTTISSQQRVSSKVQLSLPEPTSSTQTAGGYEAHAAVTTPSGPDTDTPVVLVSTPRCPDLRASSAQWAATRGTAAADLAASEEDAVVIVRQCGLVSAASEARSNEALTARLHLHACAGDWEGAAAAFLRHTREHCGLAVERGTILLVLSLIQGHFHHDEERQLLRHHRQTQAEAVAGALGPEEQDGEPAQSESEESDGHDHDGRDDLLEDIVDPAAGEDTPYRRAVLAARCRNECVRQAQLYGYLDDRDASFLKQLVGVLASPPARHLQALLAQLPAPALLAVIPEVVGALRGLHRHGHDGAATRISLMPSRTETALLEADGSAHDVGASILRRAAEAVKGTTKSADARAIRRAAVTVAAAIEDVRNAAGGARTASDVAAAAQFGSTWLLYLGEGEAAVLRCQLKADLSGELQAAASDCRAALRQLRQFITAAASGSPDVDMLSRGHRAAAAIAEPLGRLCHTAHAFVGVMEEAAAAERHHLQEDVTARCATRTAIGSAVALAACEALARLEHDTRKLEALVTKGTETLGAILQRLRDAAQMAGPPVVAAVRCSLRLALSPLVPCQSWLAVLPQYSGHLEASLPAGSPLLCALDHVAALETFFTDDSNDAHACIAAGTLRDVTALGRGWSLAAATKALAMAARGLAIPHVDAGPIRNLCGRALWLAVQTYESSTPRSRALCAVSGELLLRHHLSGPSPRAMAALCEVLAHCAGRGGCPADALATLRKHCEDGLSNEDLASGLDGVAVPAFALAMRHAGDPHALHAIARTFADRVDSTATAPAAAHCAAIALALCRALPSTQAALPLRWSLPLTNDEAFAGIESNIRAASARMAAYDRSEHDAAAEALAVVAAVLRAMTTLQPYDAAGDEIDIVYDVATAIRWLALHRDRLGATDLNSTLASLSVLCEGSDLVSAGGERVRRGLMRRWASRHDGSAADSPSTTREGGSVDVCAEASAAVLGRHFCLPHEADAMTGAFTTMLRLTTDGEAEESATLWSPAAQLSILLSVRVVLGAHQADRVADACPKGVITLYKRTVAALTNSEAQRLPAMAGCSYHLRELLREHDAFRTAAARQLFPLSRLVLETLPRIAQTSFLHSETAELKVTTVSRTKLFLLQDVAESALQAMLERGATSPLSAARTQQLLEEAWTIELSHTEPPATDLHVNQAVSRSPAGNRAAGVPFDSRRMARRVRFLLAQALLAHSCEGVRTVAAFAVVGWTRALVHEATAARAQGNSNRRTERLAALASSPRVLLASLPTNVDALLQAVTTNDSSGRRVLHPRRGLLALQPVAQLMRLQTISNRVIATALRAAEKSNTQPDAGLASSWARRVAPHPTSHLRPPAEEDAPVEALTPTDAMSIVHNVLHLPLEPKLIENLRATDNRVNERRGGFGRTPAGRTLRPPAVAMLLGGVTATGPLKWPIETFAAWAAARHSVEERIIPANVVLAAESANVGPPEVLAARAATIADGCLLAPAPFAAFAASFRDAVEEHRDAELAGHLLARFLDGCHARLSFDECFLLVHLVRDGLVPLAIVQGTYWPNAVWSRVLRLVTSVSAEETAARDDGTIAGLPIILEGLCHWIWGAGGTCGAHGGAPICGPMQPEAVSATLTAILDATHRSLRDVLTSSVIQPLLARYQEQYAMPATTAESIDALLMSPEHRLLSTIKGFDAVPCAGDTVVGRRRSPLEHLYHRDDALRMYDRRGSLRPAPVCAPTLTYRAVHAAPFAAQQAHFGARMRTAIAAFRTALLRSLNSGSGARQYPDATPQELRTCTHEHHRQAPQRVHACTAWSDALERVLGTLRDATHTEYVQHGAQRVACSDTRLAAWLFDAFVVGAPQEGGDGNVHFCGGLEPLLTTLVGLQAEVAGDASPCEAVVGVTRSDAAVICVNVVRRLLEGLVALAQEQLTGVAAMSPLCPPTTASTELLLAIVGACGGGEVGDRPITDLHHRGRLVALADAANDLFVSRDYQRLPSRHDNRQASAPPSSDDSLFLSVFVTQAVAAPLVAAMDTHFLHSGCARRLSLVARHPSGMAGLCALRRRVLASHAGIAGPQWAAAALRADAAIRIAARGELTSERTAHTRADVSCGVLEMLAVALVQCAASTNADAAHAELFTAILSHLTLLADRGLPGHALLSGRHLQHALMTAGIAPRGAAIARTDRIGPRDALAQALVQAFGVSWLGPILEDRGWVAASVALSARDIALALGGFLAPAVAPAAVLPPGVLDVVQMAAPWTITETAARAAASVLSEPIPAAGVCAAAGQQGHVFFGGCVIDIGAHGHRCVPAPQHRAAVLAALADKGLFHETIDFLVKTMRAGTLLTPTGAAAVMTAATAVLGAAVALPVSEERRAVEGLRRIVGPVADELLLRNALIDVVEGPATATTRVGAQHQLSISLQFLQALRQTEAWLDTRFSERKKALATQVNHFLVSSRKGDTAESLNRPPLRGILSLRKSAAAVTARLVRRLAATLEHDVTAFDMLLLPSAAAVLPLVGCLREAIADAFLPVPPLVTRCEASALERARMEDAATDLFAAHCRLVARLERAVGTRPNDAAGATAFNDAVQAMTFAPFDVYFARFSSKRSTGTVGTCSAEEVSHRAWHLQRLCRACDTLLATGAGGLAASSKAIDALLREVALLLKGRDGPHVASARRAAVWIVQSLAAVPEPLMATPQALSNALRLGRTLRFLGEPLSTQLFGWSTAAAWYRLALRTPDSDPPLLFGRVLAPRDAAAAEVNLVQCLYHDNVVPHCLCAAGTVSSVETPQRKGTAARVAYRHVPGPLDGLYPLFEDLLTASLCTSAHHPALLSLIDWFAATAPLFGTGALGWRRVWAAVWAFYNRVAAASAQPDQPAPPRMAQDMLLPVLRVLLGRLRDGCADAEVLALVATAPVAVTNAHHANHGPVAVRAQLRDVALSSARLLLPPTAVEEEVDAIIAGPDAPPPPTIPVPPASVGLAEAALRLPCEIRPLLERYRGEASMAAVAVQRMSTIVADERGERERAAWSVVGGPESPLVSPDLDASTTRRAAMLADVLAAGADASGGNSVLSSQAFGTWVTGIGRAGRGAQDALVARMLCLAATGTPAWHAYKGPSTAAAAPTGTLTPAAAAAMLAAALRLRPTVVGAEASEALDTAVAALVQSILLFLATSDCAAGAPLDTASLTAALDLDLSHGAADELRGAVAYALRCAAGPDTESDANASRSCVARIAANVEASRASAVLHSICAALLRKARPCGGSAAAASEAQRLASAHAALPGVTPQRRGQATATAAFAKGVVALLSTCAADAAAEEASTSSQQTADSGNTDQDSQQIVDSFEAVEAAAERFIAQRRPLVPLHWCMALGHVAVAHALLPLTPPAAVGAPPGLLFSRDLTRHIVGGPLSSPAGREGEDAAPVEVAVAVASALIDHSVTETDATTLTVTKQAAAALHAVEDVLVPVAGRCRRSAAAGDSSAAEAAHRCGMLLVPAVGPSAEQREAALRCSRVLAEGVLSAADHILHAQRDAAVRHHGRWVDAKPVVAVAIVAARMLTQRTDAPREREPKAAVPKAALSVLGAFAGLCQHLCDDRRCDWAAAFRAVVRTCDTDHGTDFDRAPLHTAEGGRLLSQLAELARLAVGDASRSQTLAALAQLAVKHRAQLTPAALGALRAHAGDYVPPATRAAQRLSLLSPQQQRLRAESLDGSLAAILEMLPQAANGTTNAPAPAPHEGLWLRPSVATTAWVAALTHCAEAVGGPGGMACLRLSHCQAATDAVLAAARHTVCAALLAARGDASDGTICDGTAGPARDALWRMVAAALEAADRGRYASPLLPLMSAADAAAFVAQRSTQSQSLPDATVADQAALISPQPLPGAEALCGILRELPAAVEGEENLVAAAARACDIFCVLGQAAMLLIAARTACGEAAAAQSLGGEAVRRVLEGATAVLQAHTDTPAANGPLQETVARLTASLPAVLCAAEHALRPGKGKDSVGGQWEGVCQQTVAWLCAAGRWRVPAAVVGIPLLERVLVSAAHSPAGWQSVSAFLVTPSGAGVVSAPEGPPLVAVVLAAASRHLLPPTSAFDVAVRALGAEAATILSPPSRQAKPLRAGEALPVLDTIVRVAADAFAAPDDLRAAAYERLLLAHSPPEVLALMESALHPLQRDLQELPQIGADTIDRIADAVAVVAGRVPDPSQRCAPVAALADCLLLVAAELSTTGSITATATAAAIDATAAAIDHLRGHPPLWHCPTTEGRLAAVRALLLQ